MNGQQQFPIDPMTLGSKTMITYRMANGELIYGEYGWVTDLEFFEESSEPTEVIKETWVCWASSSETIVPYGYEELVAEIAEEEHEERQPHLYSI